MVAKPRQRTDQGAARIGVDGALSGGVLRRENAHLGNREGVGHPNGRRAVP